MLIPTIHIAPGVLPLPRQPSGSVADTNETQALPISILEMPVIREVAPNDTGKAVAGEEGQKEEEEVGKPYGLKFCFWNNGISYLKILRTHIHPSRHSKSA